MSQENVEIVRRMFGGLPGATFDRAVVVRSGRRMGRTTPSDGQVYRGHEGDRGFTRASDMGRAGRDDVEPSSDRRRR